jgi:hypothetical protein
MSTADQITLEVNELSEPQQRRVLEFTRALKPATIMPAIPPGATLSDLKSLTGLFSPADLKEISSAIEEGCENIDADHW